MWPWPAEVLALACLPPLYLQGSRPSIPPPPPVIPSSPLANNLRWMTNKICVPARASTNVYHGIPRIVITRLGRGGALDRCHDVRYI